MIFRSKLEISPSHLATTALFNTYSTFLIHSSSPGISATFGFAKAELMTLGRVFWNKFLASFPISCWVEIEWFWVK